MYELVNTSLPNGLIAGTHGFATVAMTKGMPDSLRMRVEAYCGYSHRSSAHDETYYSENPVNWFHAILPQGEHVVGRAAPAEFDYTGRTNRLVRVLVFGKGKMPLAGGVAVLLKKARRLQEPWTGDARWLEEDKATESALRSDSLPAAKDAPSWRKKFGDSEGLTLAKGFARLLAKNISSGGKAIYFKTSAAHDVSGGELLYLYADLINLLPVEMRGRATFSTYPAALPSGAICHLRGVYDRDRAFDMAKVAQPWVDCETNTVHNAAMLPEEEIDPQKPMPKTSGGRVVATESRPRRMQSNNIKQYLPVDRKKQDPLIWILAAIVVIVVGFVAYVLPEILKKEGKAEGAQLNEENRITSISNDNAVADAEIERQKQEALNRADEEAKRAREEMDRKERAVAEKKKRDEQAKRDRKAREEADKAAAALREREMRLRQEQEAVAFTNATEITIVTNFISIANTILGDTDKERLTNGVLRVFYYDASGLLTNKATGFICKRRRNPLKSKEDEDAYQKNYTLQSGKDSLGEKGPCILWYDTQKKVLYWDWTPLYDKEPEQWFFFNGLFPPPNDKDLKAHCFGSNDAVFDTWCKLKGVPKFWILKNQDKESKPISGTNLVLKIDMLRPKDTNQRPKNKKRNPAEGNLAEKQEKLNNFNAAKQKVLSLINELEKIWADIKMCKDKEKGNVKLKKGETKADVKSTLTTLKRRATTKSGEIRSEVQNNPQLKCVKFKTAAGALQEQDISACREALSGRTSSIQNEITESKMPKVEESGDDKEQWRDDVLNSRFKVIAVEALGK